MKRLLNIMQYLFNLIETKISPYKYAKKRVGNLGKRVVFYGMKPNMFGDEPWLISIGDETEITADVAFITHDGSVNVLRDLVPDLELVDRIEIGNKCFVGVRSTILAPTRLGNRVIVGAGSLVKGSFPDNCVIAGVPAKVICTIDEFLKKAEKKSTHTGQLRKEERVSALKSFFQYDQDINTKTIS